MAFSDPQDLPPRPSTASSASGSAGTEMTSGDPFDLEETPEQSDADRNRFSSHKQWQSDGGPTDSNRSSLRNVPMHARGSSLSSSASELERSIQVPAAAEDVFAYDYDDSPRNPQLKPRSQLQVEMPNSASLNGQMDWPDFSQDFTLEGSPAYGNLHVPQTDEPGFPMAGHDHMGGGSGGISLPPLSVSRTRDTANGDSFGSPRGPENTLEFPNVVPPNPAALDEDASVATLAAELDRMLDDMRGALKSTSRALRQSAGLDEEEPGYEGGLSSSVEEETDAGFESVGSGGFRSGVETDEEGY